MTRSTWPPPPPPGGDLDAAPLAVPGVAAAVRARFSWRGDPWASFYADTSGWLADPRLLAAIGPALAALATSGGTRPDAVLGLQSEGFGLGVLTAAALGVGFVPVRKRAEPLADDDGWRTATTPPDYTGAHRQVAFRRRHVPPGCAVVLVDDWVATGGQALGVQRLVADAGGHWLGVVAVVDALTDRRVRRDLGVRSIVREAELW